jgi:hypothetical protein
MSIEGAEGRRRRKKREREERETCLSVGVVEWDFKMKS